VRAQNFAKVKPKQPHREKHFIGRDFNGHVALNHSFNFGERNNGGVSIINVVHELVIVNCSFKKEKRLVTFKIQTPIDYFFIRVIYRMLCKDAK